MKTEDIAHKTYNEEWKKREWDADMDWFQEILRKTLEKYDDMPK